ncbi:MAG: efflux RND transporter permease subunit [Planctomycetota bacterium]
MDSFVRNRNLLLALAVVLLVVCIPIARELSFDQTIDSFFRPDNPDIQILKQSRKDFGGDEFVIVAWKQAGLIQTHPDGDFPELSPAAGKAIEELSTRLSELPGVDGRRTRDLHRILTKTPRNLNTRRAMLRLFEGVLLNAEQETTSIVLQLVPESDAPIPRVATIQSIRAIVRELRPDASVAGEAVQIQDMFDLVERDGNLLYLASIIVLSLVLWVIFHNVRWVLASVGIVILSVITTRAMFVLAGARLSMVSSMLNSLVTIISIGTTTHIIVHYRELRSMMDGRTAAIATIRELASPVFWTIATVAVGFAALLVSEIVPVRSFAIMMSLGTLMVPLITLLILPAAFASGNVPVPGRVRMEDQLDALLDRMALTVDRHPLATSMVCGLLTLATLPGLWIMQVETDFSKNFRESSPIVQSLKFVEARLGPAGSWDVSFDVPDPINNSFLIRTRELTNLLKALQDEGITLDVLSLNDAIDIPPRVPTSAVARLERLQKRQGDLVESFYNTERQRMRIVLRSPEQQTTEAKLEQIQRVRTIVESHFADAASSVVDQSGGSDAASHSGSSVDGDSDTAAMAGRQRGKPTASGLFVLMARIIDSLLEDQMKSFLWACVGTVACMAIAFRSLRIGLISLVPNVFPIILVTGALGLLNVPVNIGTAMIASVSMGFTCSVHYIAAFEKALPVHGMSKALQIAQASAGKAVVLAHIALVAGFLVLTVSEFIPLVYFGAILSLSMIGGLISDLVLLPLLLRWTTKPVTAGGSG